MLLSVLHTKTSFSFMLLTVSLIFSSVNVCQWQLPTFFSCSFFSRPYSPQLSFVSSRFPFVYLTIAFALIIPSSFPSYTPLLLLLCFLVFVYCLRSRSIFRVILSSDSERKVAATLFCFWKLNFCIQSLMPNC